MRWIHRSRNEGDACDDAGLRAMIWGQLDGRREKQLTKHLETCVQCQRTITELAAAPSTWSDATRALEPSAVGDQDDEELEFDLAAEHLPIEQELISWGVIEPSETGDLVGILGRYDLRRVLGFGGTGVVFKAFDRDLGRVVAVKVLAPALSVNGPARRRFAREAQAAAAVVHENVVAVHHVESSGKCPYIVMQYIDGESLQDMVMRDGPIDVKSALRLSMQVSDALDSSHGQGLIHRDIKPANLMIGQSGQRVWVTDFGLARAVDDASLTRTGFIAGTPHYMSPEQARGEIVGPTSDLFSLGGTMFFMLTGRAPFRADRTLAILNRICNERHRPIRDINAQVPAAFAALIDQLLAKSASDRPVSAAAVRDECKRLLELHASGRLPLTGSPRRHRKRTMKALTLGIVGLVLLGLGWFAWDRSARTNVAEKATVNLAKDRAKNAYSAQVAYPRAPSVGAPNAYEADGYQFVAPQGPPQRSQPSLTFPLPTTSESGALENGGRLSESSQNLAINDSESRATVVRQQTATPEAASPVPAEETNWNREIKQIESGLRELEQNSPVTAPEAVIPDPQRQFIDRLEADLRNLEQS